MTSVESNFEFGFIDTKDKSQHLYYALKRSVEQNPADVLLLSGGVDSSLLAALAPQTPAITVVLEGKGDDLGKAQKVVERFGTHWYPIEITEEQAIVTMRELMTMSNSYDLAIKNDIVIYEGLKYAASLGFRTVRTGDAADEWFAGYSYLHQENIDFKESVEYLIPRIRIPSSRLGKAMNLKMTYPYLSEEVLELASSFSAEDNMVELNIGFGDYAQEITPTLADIKTWGKISLRLASYGELPPEIIWRQKKSIEYGSGLYLLENILTESVTSEEMNQIENSGKHFWNVAHGKLYLIFRQLGLEVPLPEEGQYACTWCGGGVPNGEIHCHSCGGFYVDRPLSTLFANE